MPPKHGKARETERQKQILKMYDTYSIHHMWAVCHSDWLLSLSLFIPICINTGKKKARFFPVSLSLLPRAFLLFLLLPLHVIVAFFRISFALLSCSFSLARVSFSFHILASRTVADRVAGSILKTCRKNHPEALLKCEGIHTHTHNQHTERHTHAEIRACRANSPGLV